MVNIMLFSIRTESTLLAIRSILILKKANKKAKQHKIGAN
jgi:hypothetical protein